MIATCPACADELDIPVAFAGRPVRCGSCNTVFTPEQPRLDAELPIARSSRPGNHPPSRRPPQRKSNAGVYLLMLFTLIVFGGCTGCCTFGIYALIFPDFQQASDAAGRFDALFPGPTQPVMQTWDDGTEEYKASGLEAIQDLTEVRFFVFYVDLPDEFFAVGKTNALLNLGDIVAEYNAPTTLRSRSENTRHGSHDAVDIQYDDLDLPGGMILRLIDVDGRVYVIGVVGHIAPNDPRAQKFFTSVTIDSK